jgi:hypothetical protein
MLEFLTHADSIPYWGGLLVATLIVVIVKVNEHYDSRRELE